MLTPGLVSVTFRSLSPADVARLAADAGLRAIEWGGDVHVPHGDLDRAREVAQLTRDAGLTVAAYGSYYRLGKSEGEGLSFARVLDSAAALGAPAIRVWAGTVGSAQADDAHRRRIAEESLRIAGAAAGAGISVAYEYHGGTLTDTAASTTALLAAAQHPNLHTLWQPSVDLPPDDRAASLSAVLPRLSNVHVFQWASPRERRPLRDGTAEWARYLSILRTTGRDHHLLLEFVRDESPEQLKEDAATLNEWLAQE